MITVVWSAVHRTPVAVGGCDGQVVGDGQGERTRPVGRWRDLAPDFAQAGAFGVDGRLVDFGGRAGVIDFLKNPIAGVVEAPRLRPERLAVDLDGEVRFATAVKCACANETNAVTAVTHHHKRGIVQHRGDNGRFGHLCTPTQRNARLANRLRQVQSGKVSG
ncbi:MAG: hypothetical protein IPG51_05650 [Chloroflexi bacterium]|nr:hypothetical protein [Chloroflexota bacterium]